MARYCHAIREARLILLGSRAVTMRYHLGIDLVTTHSRSNVFFLAIGKSVHNYSV